MGSHRVHTFSVPRVCSILAWLWLFTAEGCCQEFKIILSDYWLIYVVFLDSNKYHYKSNPIIWLRKALLIIPSSECTLASVICVFSVSKV